MNSFDDIGARLGGPAEPSPDMPPEERFGPPPEDNPFVGPAAPRSSAFFSAASLDGKPVPPRQWLVADLVPMSTVTLLGGDGGTGKSLLALQLAVSVASDGKWIGRGVAHGGALFISAEDDTAELHRRMADVVQAAGVALPDLDRLTMRSLAGEDALFAHIDRGAGVLTPSALYAEVEARIAAERPALVVLDTLADLFPGNENDRAQARQFIGMLRGLAIRHECAVMLLAHPSLTGLNSGSGTSGSTGWNNSVRSRLYLERVVQDGYEANPDARILSSKKANHARVGVEINVSWRDGAFVVEGEETSLDRMAASSKAQRVFLKLLRVFREQGRRVNHAGASSYAPKLFSEHPDNEGVTRRAFKAAMDTMLSSGVIAIEWEGPASRRVSFLVEVVR